jgi:hypothetical protein
MPLRKRQPTEHFRVELEDRGQAREFVEFDATAAAFPMTDALRLYPQLCRDHGLFEP